MDSICPQQNSDIPELKSPSDSVTHLMVARDRYNHQLTSPFGSYPRATYGGREAPAMNYNRSPAVSNFFGYGNATSSSKKPWIVPWSAVEMLETVDDNLVVMDEVLVASATSGRKSRRSSLCHASGRDDAGGRGSPSSSPPVGNQNMNRTRDLKGARNEFGNSQVKVHHRKSAHRREEMLANLSPMMSKMSEAHLSESLLASVLRTHSPTQSLAQQPMARSSPGSNYAPLTKPLYPKGITPVSKPQHSNEGTSTLKPNIRPELRSEHNSLESHEWSVMDDGIEVGMQFSTDNSLTREGLGVLIQSMLYGSAKRNRLPVFSDICPGETPPTDCSP